MKKTWAIDEASNEMLMNERKHAVEWIWEVYSDDWTEAVTYAMCGGRGNKVDCKNYNPFSIAGKGSDATVICHADRVSDLVSED